jgi:hypothetical protein
MPKTKMIAIEFGQVILGLLAAYIYCYWIFWRGGGYLLHHWIAPLFASAPPAHPTPTTTTTSPAGGNAIEVIKVLWSILGAAFGTITAAFVRRWFVYRTLKDKLSLLNILREQMLSQLGRNAGWAPAVAISGGMVKYLFGEKEYAQIARYMSPETAMSILNTLSAIDLVAGTARDGASPDKMASMLEPIIKQLESFDLAAIRQELRMLRDNFDRTGSDVVSLSSEK